MNLTDKQVVALFLLKKPYPMTCTQISDIIATPRRTVNAWKLKYYHLSLKDILPYLLSMGRCEIVHVGDTSALERLNGYLKMPDFWKQKYESKRLLYDKRDT